MISLAFLLSACGSSAGYEKKIEQFREALAECGQAAFTADMTADDGTCVSEYTVNCRHKDGETVLQLLSPQLIAGVSARLTEKGTALEYDGLSLETGTLLGCGISPIEAPKVILEAMSGGVVSQMRREPCGDTDTLAFCVERGNGIRVALWLAYNDLTPLRAEICSSGNTVIRCVLSEWETE